MSKQSLSSVVSNLVRASMGSGVSNTVTDEDLDRHVAELILKEAKQKAERYGKDGIQAYLPHITDANAPKTNKRFLTSIIRSTDDHNKTILRAQAQAAQDIKREREEAERRERRARAEEATATARMRRSSSFGRMRSDSDAWRRNEVRGPNGKRRERSWDRIDDEDEFEAELWGDSSKSRRSHLARSGDWRERCWERSDDEGELEREQSREPSKRRRSHRSARERSRDSRDDDERSEREERKHSLKRRSHRARSEDRRERSQDHGDEDEDFEEEDHRESSKQRHRSHRTRSSERRRYSHQHRRRSRRSSEHEASSRKRRRHHSRSLSPTWTDARSVHGDGEGRSTHSTRTKRKSERSRSNSPTPEDEYHSSDRHRHRKRPRNSDKYHESHGTKRRRTTSVSRSRSRSRSRSPAPPRSFSRFSSPVVEEVSVKQPSPEVSTSQLIEDREARLRSLLKAKHKSAITSSSGPSTRRYYSDSPRRDASSSPAPQLKSPKEGSHSSKTAVSSMSISRSPSPEAIAQLPSKMDKYFEESYDPRLDVAPLTAPKVPATGLINNAEFEGWDAMLELIKIRREDKEEKKRMERLGLTKEKVKSKSKKTKVGGIESADDRWSSGGLNIMEIEYNKRGSVREWDMGKEGF